MSEYKQMIITQNIVETQAKPLIHSSPKYYGKQVHCLKINAANYNTFSEVPYCLTLVFGNETFTGQITIKLLHCLQDGTQITDISKQQYIDSFNYIKNASLSVIFVPKEGQYTHIMIISDEYKESLLDMNNTTLYRINTQLVPGGKIWKKIGVQARPSFQMVINGEYIKVGKNEIYELTKSDGVIIKSFYCFPKNSYDYCIIDYEEDDIDSEDTEETDNNNDNNNDNFGS